jgi:hypothetical protein
MTGQLSQLPGIKAVGLTSNGLTLGRKLPQLKEAGGCPAALPAALLFISAALVYQSSCRCCFGAQQESEPCLELARLLFSPLTKPCRPEPAQH